MLLHRFTKIHAPEFPTGMEWLGGAPLTMQHLRGKPVLIDFWTFSCVNCLRTQPHLTSWHEKYAKLGLQIIGVHTPEFAFEKDVTNVKKAIAQLGVPYPVVLDNDYAIWNLYANRWWPRKFLIDKNGTIVYDHVGEGGYGETEMAIQKALMDAGVKKLPRIDADTSGDGGVCYKTTAETYLGYLRGKIGNAEAFLPDAEEAFTDRGMHDDDAVYLHGHWRLAGEFVEHTRRVATASEYLLLTYSAFGVNLVMETADGKAATIDVELDGLPIAPDMAGEDVTFVKGRAIVTVKEARMYRLVKADVYHRGALKLSTGSSGLRMYAFTFDGCAQ